MLCWTRARTVLAAGLLGASAATFGFVTHTPSPPPVEQVSCGTDVACWSALMREVTSDQSSLTALNILDSAVETGLLDDFTCHDVAHAIGQTTASQESRELLGEAFTYASTSCGAGFYHGVIVEVSARSSLEEFTTNLSELCPSEVDWKSFTLWSCGHGIGHGLVFLHDDLVEASSSCATLVGALQAGCFSGALMQDLNDNMGDPERLSDPFSACKGANPMSSQATSVFLNNCYDMHAGFLTRHLGFEEALRVCVTVALPHNCAEGVGRQVHNGGPLESNISGICRAANVELFEPCLRGAAENTFAHFGAVAPALEVCAQLEHGDAELCRVTIAELE